jgi:hypothetical protein
VNRLASRNPEADAQLYADLLRNEADLRRKREAVEVIEHLESDGLLRITARDLPEDDE